jgi:hypothetical protein
MQHASVLAGVTTMAPTYIEENLSTPSIAFPLRLSRGLLQKTDERDAYLMLLEIMARTPRGSWAGHHLFGFREFFPEVFKEGLSPESRAHLTTTTVKEINAVLADLGLTRYRVDSLIPDKDEKDFPADRARGMGHGTERRGVTLMLRESGSDRAAGYAL